MYYALKPNGLIYSHGVRVCGARLDTDGKDKVILYMRSIHDQVVTYSTQLSY